MAHRTVTLRCANIVEDEFCAGGTITPGMLIEVYRASAAVAKVRAHNASEDSAIPMFACEDQEQGHDMSDNYSSGDQVKCRTFRSGDLVAALTLADETIQIGTKLESNGDGTLKAQTIDAASEASYMSWIATAEEDLSGNTSNTLCKVRIR